MQRLLPFGEGDLNIELSADLTIRENDIVDIVFKWNDPDKKIVFGADPEGGRHMGLWQQTCFEVFMQPSTAKNYLEINLTARKAWNVFHFDDYRMPQPPRELPDAELKDFHLDGSGLRATFKLPDVDIRKVNVSFCAVIVLKDAGITYWSVKHADIKPNFHHFGSFITERTAT